MCNTPCSICADYFTCDLTFVYKNNRCRTCIHDTEDVISKNCPCLKCQGSDYNHKNSKDYYEKKLYVGN